MSKSRFHVSPKNKLSSVSGFNHFQAVARSEDTPDTRSILPETSAPVQQLSRFFLYQSYFDDTLLENAILAQSRNEPIVSSTLKNESIPGYAVGLHPSSETPVAIQFNVGAQSSSSQAIIVKPGQVVRPHGIPFGEKRGAFSGFNWGLPFGWLGGGNATLLVFQTPDADVAWPGNPEIIFHRQRMQVVADAATPAVGPFNWPLRFPWIQAFQGTVPTSQQGQPQMAIEPTRVVLRLRVASLAAPQTMRIIFQATNDFDVDSAGAVITTPVGFIENIWGTYAAGGGGLTSQYPYVELGDVIQRLGADGGSVILTDMTGDITEDYVDVVRYGRL